MIKISPTTIVMHIYFIFNKLIVFHKIVLIFYINVYIMNNKKVSIGVPLRVFFSPVRDSDKKFDVGTKIKKNIKTQENQ